MHHVLDRRSHRCAFLRDWPPPGEHQSISVLALHEVCAAALLHIHQAPRGTIAVQAVQHSRPSGVDDPRHLQSRINCPSKQQNVVLGRVGLPHQVAGRRLHRRWRPSQPAHSAALLHQRLRLRVAQSTFHAQDPFPRRHLFPIAELGPADRRLRVFGLLDARVAQGPRGADG